MGEDRLLKVVSSEAMETGSRVRWAQDLECSLEIFGWGGVNADALSGLAMEEVGCVLKDVAWGEVKEVWRKEAQEHPKLKMIRKLN